MGRLAAVLGLAGIVGNALGWQQFNYRMPAREEHTVHATQSILATKGEDLPPHVRIRLLDEQTYQKYKAKLEAFGQHVPENSGALYVPWYHGDQLAREDIILRNNNLTLGRAVQYTLHELAHRKHKTLSPENEAESLAYEREVLEPLAKEEPYFHHLLEYSKPTHPSALTRKAYQLLED